MPLVTLYGSVREFIGAELSTDQDTDLADIRAALIDDQGVHEFLETQIVDALGWSRHAFVSDALHGAEVEDAQTSGISVDELDVVDAYEFEGEDELFVTLRARVSADIDFQLSRRQADSLSRDEQRSLTFWGEDLVSGRRSAVLKVEAELVLPHGLDLDAWIEELSEKSEFPVLEIAEIDVL